MDIKKTVFIVANEMQDERRRLLFSDEDRGEAYRTVLEALLKRMPEKPFIINVSRTGAKSAGCRCGEHIMDDENFCSNCGQAIDWSGAE